MTPDNRSSHTLPAAPWGAAKAWRCYFLARGARPPFRTMPAAPQGRGEPWRLPRPLSLRRAAPGPLLRQGPPSTSGRPSGRRSSDYPIGGLPRPLGELPTAPAFNFTSP